LLNQKEAFCTLNLSICLSLWWQDDKIAGFLKLVEISTGMKRYNPLEKELEGKMQVLCDR